MPEEPNQSTKRELQSTKRELQSTKRELQSTKRELQSTKRIKDVATDYGDFGAAGNYTVSTDIAGEEKVLISAGCIRVLDGGELNILTDVGLMVFVRPGHVEERVTGSAESENARGQCRNKITARSGADDLGRKPPR